MTEKAENESSDKDAKQPSKKQGDISPLTADAREAARMLGIGRSTFLKLHNAGKVPLPVHFGRAVRWRRAELEEWLAAGAPSRIQWQQRISGRKAR